MDEKPDFLLRGERARLFPVLAETSKEGRTLSIVLACMETIDDFGKALLADLGIKVGARTRLETYTEVVLRKGGDSKLRPDGLLVLRSGATRWTALVEAKVGNADLTTEQIESYLELAKINGIDALLTISNQFAPMPSHHPIAVSSASAKKAALWHWSWMYVLTQAMLHLEDGEVRDREQRVILNEMIRFLSHPSAGVKSFDQMPAAWTAVAHAVQAGATLSPKSPETQEVVGAWYQETRDLSLILSRQLGEEVSVKVPRAHAVDPALRLREDADRLAKEGRLRSVFSVPNTAAAIEVAADFNRRTIYASMRVSAPADRKSTRARLTWLLRQLGKSKPDNIHVRLYRPGRGPCTQHPLARLRETPEAAEQNGQVVSSFEVVFARDLAGRFSQRRNFVIDLEQAIPDFYEQVGQHLKAWQPRAPRIREDRTDPADVGPAAMQKEAELGALDRNEPGEQSPAAPQTASD
ncbi:hypothetical protein [Coralloluteibacterium stylophorae]|uniref:Stress response protein n=1 Tax=Coralloluteibacterium stylophorae TaxID=1776034 RepID=A0A8J8AY90_9GAMM|nr:hypothetical protein [Coralloluteibacterium stylophorae]MBS7457366.1 hypothetical protein [Coralloluteibacterium stylophorae]